MRNIRRFVGVLLSIVFLVCNTGICDLVSAFAQEEIGYQDMITISFVDSTNEKWIANDNAVMELVDNTYGYDKYYMTTTDNITWSVKVPRKAYNITFNRYNDNKSVMWNSWSAGGRDGHITYCAEGNSNGYWTGEEESQYKGFRKGDIILLDLTDFNGWLNCEAMIYANFSNVSKAENGGRDINLNNCDKNIYSPQLFETKTQNNIYAYTITEEDEGKEELRFWRGNENTLWNCSILLKYEDYASGYDCIKVTGWNDTGKLIKLGVFGKDSDGDGLSNELELQIGSDIYNIDSDEDGLPDSYEYIYLGTSLTQKDSDGNGISDYQEDFDNDGVCNGIEYINGTDPFIEDTDNDGLNDKKEIEDTNTNPILSDTDNDGLVDSEDILFGFNPLNPDTDGNGVLDGDEKREQNRKLDINNTEHGEILNISVQMEISGNIDNKVTIRDIYGEDLLSSNVVGLVGVPVSIETDEEFEKAKITFNYDEEKLSGINEEDLAILWYDESNNLYQILDKESVVDIENNTVSYTTTHFSTYMLVDKKVWYNTWKEELNYRKENVSYDFAYVLDCSGSMSGTRINNAVKTIKGFINSMSEEDNAAIVTFNDNATLLRGFSKKNELGLAIGGYFTASGGTNVDRGLKLAINQYKTQTNDNKRVMILVCDGDVNYVSDTIKNAITQNITIYTVNVGYRGSNAELKRIADETGGEYYYCEKAEDIEPMVAFIQDETLYNIDTTDTDGDGLYDVYETTGFHLQNGVLLKSDPNNTDTDNDGLSDYEELGIIYNLKVPDNSRPEVPNLTTVLKQLNYIGLGETTYVPYVIARSNPSKYDTDDDRLNDYTDEHPWSAYCGGNKCEEISVHKHLADKNGYYICEDCGYKIPSPEMEDERIMTDEDYRDMLAIAVMCQHYSLLRIAKYGETSPVSLNEKLLINKIADIRRKYNGRYSYSDIKGNCICEKYEIDNSEASVIIENRKVTTLGITFYNGIALNSISFLVGGWGSMAKDVGLKTLSYIATLIGVGIDDEIGVWDFISLSGIAIEKINTINNSSITKHIPNIIDRAAVLHDYISCNSKIGDNEISICIHRKGYGRSVEQSHGTFVMKDNGNISFYEFSEYGYGDELKP